MQSKIASFSGKLTAVWYWRATSLEITVRKSLCSVVMQTFLFDMYFNWLPKWPFLLSFDCQQVVRLWPVINSVQLQNVLHAIVPTLEPKTGKHFRSCTNLTLQILWNMSQGVQYSSPWWSNNFVAALWSECKETLTCCFPSPYMDTKENFRNGFCSTSLFSK